MASGGRRSHGGEERNRRMFAQLQAQLGGSAPPRERQQRSLRQRVEDVEPLPDLESILAQLTDFNKRKDRSATQIKRNLHASSYLGEMGDAEWEVLCRTLVDLAMNRNETEFVVDLFITLLKYDEFKKEICDELMRRANAFIFDEGDSVEEEEGKSEDKPSASEPKDDSEDEEDPKAEPEDELAQDDEEKEATAGVPELLGAILVAGWPRQLSKAIESVNPVLFTTHAIVKGWILVVGGQHEDDAKMLDRCALGLTELCTSVQRSLWMRWPELCDEVYAAIKPAITHNNLLLGKRKSGLLHVLICMHSWTKPKTVTMLTKCTQTTDS